MEQTRDLRLIFPTPRLEQVREAVRARRIAAWEATRAAMAAAEAEARARRWRPIGEVAAAEAAILGQRIAEQHHLGRPWGSW